MTQDPEKEVSVTMALYRWAALVRLFRSEHVEEDVMDDADEIQKQIGLTGDEVAKMPWLGKTE